MVSLEKADTHVLIRFWKKSAVSVTSHPVISSSDKFQFGEF